MIFGDVYGILGQKADKKEVNAVNNPELFEKNLYSIPSINMDSVKSFPLHYHRHLEFVYITEGSAEMDINGKRCKLSCGDAVLVSPYILHSYIKTEECRRCIVVSEPEVLGYLGDFLVKNHPVNPHIKREKLEAEIPDIYRKLKYTYELKDARISSENKAVDLIRIISELYDIFSGYCTLTEFAHSKETDDNIYLTALKLCCDNFSDEDYSTEKLAAALSVSTSTLQKLFAKKLQMGVKEYINYLRVGNAKSLISDTTLPISSIALSCGFGTIRSFNRAFLKFYGVPPGEFRSPKGKSEQ